MSQKISSLQAEAATTGPKVTLRKQTNKLQTNSNITTYINVNNIVTEIVKQFTHLNSSIAIDEEILEVKMWMMKTNRIFGDFYPL
jgi:Tfp pilus assembly major pilin PilA